MVFAKEGVLGLVIADIDLEGAQETATQAKTVATNPDFWVDTVQVDVSVEESARAAITYATKYLGRIDYAVHSAGVSPSIEYSALCSRLNLYTDSRRHL